MKKEHIPYVVREQEIAVFGDESERFAHFFNTETKRPMRRGILNREERGSLSTVREVIMPVMGEKNGCGQKLCFSVPAAPFGAAQPVDQHENDMTMLFRELGYQVRSVPEGLAVVYGELESSNYTSIGVSCGGGLCNVCFSYLSVPVFSFSLPKAGDYIDAGAANDRGESATRIRAIKEESFCFKGHFLSKVHQSIAAFYDDMIQALVAALKDTLAGVQNMPKLSRPIIAGGSTLAGGFRDRFEKTLRETELPVAIYEVRLASSSLHSTARGTLVATLNEA